MFWLGSDTNCTTVRLGTLALTRPLLDRLRLADTIDHLAPADPQQEYSHGQVLTALLAARLDRPLALMNVAAWAADAGTELLFGIPHHKLNDDRLARSLDALFDIRHSLTAAVVGEAMRWAEVQPTRIHFDPTDITFFGRYDDSQPRPTTATLRSDDQLPPAHLVRGYASGNVSVQLGVAAYVDDFGALPIAFHCYDGNRNGHTGIREQLQLILTHQPLPANALIVSDRGTFSAEHLVTLQTYGQSALCAVPWNDYRNLFDTHRTQLNWQPASFLSQEQQRRRAVASTLPRDEYRLAVLRHTLTHRDTKATVPVRVIFVHSTAGEREERERRDDNVATIRAGLAELAGKLHRGHPQSTTESIQRQIVRLLGKRDAARFFRWQLIPLGAAERDALPAPRQGFTRPTHRLDWSFDEAAAAAAKTADGISVMVTTAPTTDSADQLFTQYKKQCYVERMHHQLKTPLAVSPVFLKTPQRVEALIHMLMLGLVAQQAAERVYRQRESAATATRDRTTADRLWEAFRSCSVLLHEESCGTVVRTIRLPDRPRRILEVLGLDSPRACLQTHLPIHQTG